MKDKWIIRGRELNQKDIAYIQKAVVEYFPKGRRYISREICHHWKWYQTSGHTKDRACRDILLFLEKQKLIKLPPSRYSGNNRNRKVKPIELNAKPLEGTVKNYPGLELKLLTHSKQYQLYNGIIQKYHYQGCKIIVGQSLRYMCFINDEPVACLGWGSAAWSLSYRDHWIGWSKETKDKNLYKIVNNIRYLILPWVKIKYLASHLLGKIAKRIQRDWYSQFSTKIYLLETFVEEERFQGTCYKAANWIYLGRTKGSAKRGSLHTFHGNIKKIFVYPLCKDFRENLIKG